jgi:hypothetical protein
LVEFRSNNPDFRLYFGDFKWGKYEGVGEKFDNNGAREYYGGFKNGAYDGVGMLHKGGKLVKSGYFEKGDFVHELTVRDCELAIGEAGKSLDEK